MTRVIYNTASTLDGFLADPDDSLEWLFAVPGADEAEGEIGPFLDGVGALVMGSTTYEWIWDHDLKDAPEKWADFYGDRIVFVFTSRELPIPEGATNLRLVKGPVAEHWDAIVDAAGPRDIWVVGGGDLVGQFADAGHLDEVRVSIAPVVLGAGRPLLPRVFASDRLRLESIRKVGQFAEVVYSFR